MTLPHSLDQAHYRIDAVRNKSFLTSIEGGCLLKMHILRGLSAERFNSPSDNRRRYADAHALLFLDTTLTCDCEPAPSQAPPPSSPPSVYIRLTNHRNTANAFPQLQSANMDQVLPSKLPCELTIKAGVPLGSSRDKGTTVSFEIDVGEGYGVLRAKVKAGFETNTTLAWKDELDVYVKPSKNAPQKSFVKLDDASFTTSVSAAWHTARLRKSGRGDFVLELFVYVEKAKKTPVTTLHRATENRVQGVLPRVREALEAGGVSFGPATLRYAATAQARLPDTQAVQVPDNTTFRQLQHIDLLQQEVDAAPDHRADDFAPVDVQINGSIVTLKLRVQDMRRALGLPLYPLCPPFREPFVYIPPPAQDMDDPDHPMSDDNIEEEETHEV